MLVTANAASIPSLVVRPPELEWAFMPHACMQLEEL